MGLTHSAIVNMKGVVLWHTQSSVDATIYRRTATNWEPSTFYGLGKTHAEAVSKARSFLEVRYQHEL